MELNFTREEFEENVRVYTNGVGYKIGFVNDYDFLWFRWTNVCMSRSYSESIEVFDTIDRVVDVINFRFSSMKKHGGDWTPMTYEDLVNKISLADIENPPIPPLEKTQ